MKRYAILTVVVLAVLVVAWTAFGQGEEKTEQRQQWENLRQRFENMSEEEREEIRALWRERLARSTHWKPELWQKSINAIEEQLAKLKASKMPQLVGAFLDQDAFIDLGGKEQAKLIEKRKKAIKDQRQALQVITNHVARLQDLHMRDGEDARFFITSTNQLKQIQEAAMEEKAKETSQLLERLIASDGRGFGGRSRGGERPPSDQQQ